MRVRFTTIATLLAVAALPATANAAEPIMKLSDVRAGMECSALSVIRGTTPSQFDISVIDVLRGDPEAIGARILFRASGPAVDATGIGPGFSGSPIYCPDANGVSRVAGAISEGVGQYGNHVALATPIEEMLGVRPAAAPQARKATALLRSAEPLASPLTVSGLSSPLRRSVMAAARKANFPLLAAPSAAATFYPPYELTPGTSVAAGLSTGDIALGAIGTVTYRDVDVQRARAAVGLVAGVDGQGDHRRRRADAAGDRAEPVGGQRADRPAGGRELVGRRELVEGDRVVDDREDVGVEQRQRTAAGGVEQVAEGP